MLTNRQNDSHLNWFDTRCQEQLRTAPWCVLVWEPETSTTPANRITQTPYTAFVSLVSHATKVSVSLDLKAAPHFLLLLHHWSGENCRDFYPSRSLHDEVETNASNGDRSRLGPDVRLIRCRNPSTNLNNFPLKPQLTAFFLLPFHLNSK